MRRSYQLLAITELFVQIWEVKEDGTISLRRKVQRMVGKKASCSWQFRLNWKPLNTYFGLLHLSKTTAR